MRRLPRRHPTAGGKLFYDSNDPVPGANSRTRAGRRLPRGGANTRESPGQTSIAMASMSAAEINIDECALIPIGVETLRATGVLPFDLYLQGEGPSRPVLYREKKLPVGDDDLEKLLQRGVRTLYIPQVESSVYREYLRATLLSNNDIPPVERYQVLREATRSVLTDALAKGDHESAVKVTSDLSEGLVQTVCDSQIVLNDLLRVMSHDYSIFTHAVNVATNCLLLARWYGINGRQELLQIGQGALLHDIGLKGVPRQIIDKPDKLSERERRIVQDHPARGFRELCRRAGPDLGAVDDRLQPSRAVRRPRVSGGPGADGNPRVRPHLRDSRRLRGAEPRPALSEGLAARRCSGVSRPPGGSGF